MSAGDHIVIFPSQCLHGCDVSFSHVFLDDLLHDPYLCLADFQLYQSNEQKKQWKRNYFWVTATWWLLIQLPLVCKQFGMSANSKYINSLAFQQY